MTICFFGDSVVKGVIYDEMKNRYSNLKTCFVNTFAQMADISVKNYARFGCTVTKGIELLTKHKNELSSFSHTILEFGGNDCDLNWSEISNSPNSIHLPNVPLPQFEEVYLKMIGIVKSAGSIPVLLSLPPLDADKFFVWVSKGLNRENILKYLGDVQYIYRWHESYSTAVKDLAKRQSTHFLDIREAFLKEKSYSDYLCSDGMHPNEKGHALICRLLKEMNIHSPLYVV